MVYCCESLKRLLKLLGIGKKVEKFLEAKGQFSIYACAKLKVRILLEGKEYMNNSQIHVSLRSSKIACSSPLLRRREEKGAIFKLRKNCGYESCSNTSLPLGNQRGGMSTPRIWLKDWLVLHSQIYENL